MTHEKPHEKENTGGLFYITVLENISDAVCLFDDSGTIRFMNNQAQKWFGDLGNIHNLEETGCIFLHEDGATPMLKDDLPFSRVCKGEAFSNLKMVIRTSANPASVALVKGTPVFDTDGAATGGAVVLQDITKLRYTEELLKENTRRLALFHEMYIESATVYNISNLVERMLHVLDKNLEGDAYGFHLLDEGVRLSVYTAVGLPDEIVGEENKQDLFMDWAVTIRLFEKDKPIKFIKFADYSPFGLAQLYLQYDFSSGVYIPVYINDVLIGFVSMLNKYGRTLSMKSLELMDLVVRQICYAIQNVKLFEAQKQELEKRIMTEAELKKAKEEAERSNTVKIQFLANMSHEIRTPLNGVMGMAGLLEFTELTGEQADIVKTIQSSSSHLLQIINDILDLSIIDAGKIELQTERVDVRELMNECRRLFTHLAQKKGLDFHISVGSDLPNVMIADKVRLVQVLSNLIGNAIKFTDKGHVLVSVTKIMDHANRVKLMFSITDTGVGIKEEDIPKLFNYFTQLDISTTKRFQGTGLGLAISKNLIELMGGEISVRSLYGKGSTFYFTCLFEVPESGGETAKPHNGLAEDPFNSGISILQVEDDLVSQMVIKQICKHAGWKISVASNGLEALDLVDREHFDVILMDIQMPGMNGIEVTKLIRERENIKGGHVAIIATTAYAMKEDRDICLQAGMDDYISKPIDLMRFKSIIDQHTI